MVHVHLLGQMFEACIDLVQVKCVRAVLLGLLIVTNQHIFEHLDCLEVLYESL